MLGITILSFGIQWYTLTYLPVIDCLPYKKGNNISAQMKVPADARVPGARLSLLFMKKTGSNKNFRSDQLPADLDSSYKLIKRFDKVIVEGKNMRRRYMVLSYQEDPMKIPHRWSFRNLMLFYYSARIFPIRFQNGKMILRNCMPKQKQKNSCIYNNRAI